MRALMLISVFVFVACAKKEAKVVTGAAVPVEDLNYVLPTGHPAIDTAGQLAAAAKPPNGAGHVPTRVSVDQLRAGLLAATGQVWVGRLVVADPSSPTGDSLIDDADMLEAFAHSLGRPNYSTSVREDHEPGLTFSKLASDAARFTCKAGVTADLLEPDFTKRFIVRKPDDVRANISELALTFWGRTLEPTSPEVEQLAALFTRVPVATDGWRVVCIAMATDARFLSY